MIIIVTGLPRSGTSLMMQILDYNGYDVLDDGQKQADRWNKRGYFECKKALSNNLWWLEKLDNVAVKVFSMFLSGLPERNYKFIVMRRNIESSAKSVEKMSISGTVKCTDVVPLYEKHFIETDKWLTGRDVLYVQFEDLLAGKNCGLDEFLGKKIQTEAVIDPGLVHF